MNQRKIDGIPVMSNNYIEGDRLEAYIKLKGFEIKFAEAILGRTISQNIRRNYIGYAGALAIFEKLDISPRLYFVPDKIGIRASASGVAKRVDLTELARRNRKQKTGVFVTLWKNDRAKTGKSVSFRFYDGEADRFGRRINYKIIDNKIYFLPCNKGGSALSQSYDQQNAKVSAFKLMTDSELGFFSLRRGFYELRVDKLRNLYYIDTTEKAESNFRQIFAQTSESAPDPKTSETFNTEITSLIDESQKKIEALSQLKRDIIALNDCFASLSESLLEVMKAIRIGGSENE